MDKKKYYLENSNKLGWGPEKAELRNYRAELLEKHIQGQKILDIGCGSGVWVNYLTQKGYDATGVDFVDQFIKQAKTKYKGKFIKADAQNLPFKNNQFDTVFLISILEHVENDLQVLKEAKRVGKRIIFVVPQKTPECLIRKGVVFKHNLDKTHQRVYTKKEINNLLKKVPLKLKKIEEIERLPAISLFNELFRAPLILKKIINKIFFTLFKEKNFYLELLVISE